MGTKTGISWTHHTWNPFRGCKKISPGCRACYMFSEQTRYGLDPTEVVRTKTWNNPLRWQRDAEQLGKRDLVFTCSWSDFFIEEADQWRTEAWYTIRRTPNLVYQILTKRSNRILQCLPGDWRDGYHNCWMGVSVESPDYLWRVDDLRQVPARCRFLSIEPLLEYIPDMDLTGIHWVIVGGESGTNYRHMDLDWARRIRDICIAQGVTFFFKQSSGTRPGMGDILDGVEHKQFPDPYFNEHPEEKPATLSLPVI